jgi:TATA-binding protein-associated factor
MDTHQLLDLFNSDSVGKEDEEGVKEEKMDSGAGTGANVADVASEDGLGGKAGSAVKELGELWDTKQYEEEYNLSQFISTLQ